jgi:hypothetical protein
MDVRLSQQKQMMTGDEKIRLIPQDLVPRMRIFPVYDP